MNNKPNVNTNNPTALCLDLGGTSLKMAIVKDGTILKKGKVETDVSRGIEGITGTYRQALPFAKDFNLDFVSVSSAGRIDSQTATCTYATQTLPDYSGFDIGSFIESLFGVPAYAINDGYAAGLGEYHGSAQQGKMLMLTIGTGLGGVIIDGGKILNFPEDRDMGHLPFPGGITQCTCGRIGCIESYASGTTLNYMLMPYERAENARKSRWIRYVEGEMPIVKCVGIWKKFLRKSADVIYALEPFDTLVLGGGVADDGKYWFNSELFDGAPYTARLSSLGNDAGLLGAYYFALNTYPNAK